MPFASELSVEGGNRIFAQGKIEPAGGLVAIAAPPGDQIRQIHVGNGDRVAAGDLLVTLASLEVRQAEIRAAEAKRAELRNQIDIAKATATSQLRGAEIRLKSAQLQRAQADLAQSQLGQIDRELAEARRVMKDLRDAANDPNVARLIGTAKLNRQELSIQSAEQEKQLKIAEAKQAIETADLGIIAAEQEVAAAKTAVAAAASDSQLVAMDEQIKVLQLQLRSSELRSPINGHVVTIDANVGQPTTVMPIMQLADIDHMICLAEVDVADLARIEIGNKATISSPALKPANKEALEGTVTSISQVVGVPRLPNPNPMARSDWRSAIVRIEIAPEDSQLAASRISLQADVSIKIRDSVVADSAAPTGE